MSQTESQETYRRDNWWGDDADPDATTGHVELEGSDAAEHIAFQEVLALTAPICARQASQPPNAGGRLAECCAWLFDGEAHDGRGDQLHHEQREQRLSEPALYLPKTNRDGEEYGVHRHRRRFNPETGYVNWGETTATDIPEFGHDTFLLAFANYLAKRHGRSTGGLTVGNTGDYLETAERHWHDQTQNSLESLASAIQFVRDKEPN